MTASTETLSLTSALEDYLETIYELVRDQKVARVRDIALARGVRAASVTPAMRRLSDLGLIRYVQREYIDLTPEGEVEARRIYSRHQALTRLFTDVLRMPPELAKADACAMEHSLSAEGLDHLVRFFEFLRVCPGSRGFLETFHRCSLVHQDAEPCGMSCSAKKARQSHDDGASLSLAELEPGQQARVAQVLGAGALRQRLLDMGLLPGVMVGMERLGPGGDPIWIKVQGFQISLRKAEAEVVRLRR